MNEVLNETTILPDAKAFFLVTTLYKKYPLVDTNVHKYLAIEFFDGTLDAFCPNCASNSVFRIAPRQRPQTVRSGYWHPSTITGNETVYFNVEGERRLTTAAKYVATTETFLLSFTCSRDLHHRMDFVIRRAETSVQKIGQYPGLADLHLPQLKRYRAVLGKSSYFELVRAVGLHAHGVGIGAFVYLRRIFEMLIKEASDTAAAESDWDQEAFDRARMVEKINILRSHLPQFIVENRKLYGILSQGVHELSEDACNSMFHAVESAIELILDEKIAIKTKQEKERNTALALQAASKATNGYDKKLKSEA